MNKLQALRVLHLNNVELMDTASPEQVVERLQGLGKIHLPPVIGDIAISSELEAQQ